MITNCCGFGWPEAEAGAQAKKYPGRVPEAETVPGFTGASLPPSANTRKLRDGMHSYPDLEAAFSLERFGRYLSWAENDRAKALELYALNTQISESLYTPLQILEVSLRNRIHTVMAELQHEAWFQDDGFLLGDHQAGQVEAAVKDIAREGKEATPSRIVAALTFSFWTAMFGKAYETLWQQGLHKIGSKDGKGLRRKDLSTPLASIRILRNRIAHHEPILYWQLQKKYSSIIEVTSWLSPHAADWCRAHSRFAEVCPDDSAEVFINCRKN